MSDQRASIYCEAEKETPVGVCDWPRCACPRYPESDERAADRAFRRQQNAAGNLLAQGGSQLTCEPAPAAPSESEQPRIVQQADGTKMETPTEDARRAFLDLCKPPPSEKLQPKMAPPPTLDDLETALRQEYGGTPTTDALIDVVMPMLRAAQSARAAISDEDREGLGCARTILRGVERAMEARSLSEFTEDPESTYYVIGEALVVIDRLTAVASRSEREVGNG